VSDWREQQRVERALTGLPSFHQAARRLLADAGELVDVEGVGVDVSAAEHDLWLAVQLVYAVQGEPESDPRPRTLRAAFGKDAKTAAETFQRVEAKLRAAGDRAGKPAYPRPRGSGDEEWLEARAALKRRARPHMRHPQIVEYSARRAVELGFSPWAIWRKSQGSRARNTEAERQARARIVVELRDRGAALADIGGIFGGRRKESVLALERAGRKAQAERRSDA
jgi:hypothetical protein